MEGASFVMDDSIMDDLRKPSARMMYVISTEGFRRLPIFTFYNKCLLAAILCGICHPFDNRHVGQLGQMLRQ